MIDSWGDLFMALVIAWLTFGAGFCLGAYWRSLF